MDGQKTKSERSRKKVVENDHPIWEIIAHWRPQDRWTVSVPFFPSNSRLVELKTVHFRRAVHSITISRYFSVLHSYPIFSKLRRVFKIMLWTLISRLPTQNRNGLLWLAEWSKDAYHFETPPKRIPLFKFTASYIKKLKNWTGQCGILIFISQHHDFEFETWSWFKYH